MKSKEDIILESANVNLNKVNNVYSIPILQSLKRNFLFTIAIPTYKRVELLKQALESALNQEDVSNYNILVVDNNPERNDETEQFMLKYRDKENISYYKNSSNIGMAGNWNKLYLLSDSEYVIMLHDDDLLLPNYLSVLTKLVSDKRFSYDAYFFPFFFIHGNKPIHQYKKVTRFKVRSLKVTDFLYGNIVGAPVGMCVKRKAVLDIDGFNPDFIPSVDYEFSVRLTQNFNVCKVFIKYLATYRISDKNESNKFETQLLFIKQDLEIKNSILINRGDFYKKIWISYFKVNSHKQLKVSAKIFKEVKFGDLKKELINEGISYNKFDYLVYIVLKIIRKLESVTWRIIYLLGIKKRII